MSRGKPCHICGCPYTKVDNPPSCECCYGWEVEMVSSIESLPMPERRRRFRARVAHFAPQVGFDPTTLIEVQ